MKKIDDLETYLDVPFSNRGRSKEEGFDCWGLIIDLTKRVHNFDLPDPEYEIKTKREIADVFLSYDISDRLHEVKIEEIQYGDLVTITSYITRTPYHVGMYVGEGKVIHIMAGGTKIEQIERLIPYITGIYRPNPSSQK